jgi:trigger factor
MYGSSVFADEVIKSVEKGLQDYMTSEKIEIFAQPLPVEDEQSKMDMNQPAEYAFTFEVGLKPDVTLPDLQSLPLKRYKIDITDQMLNEQVDMYLKNYGEAVSKEEVTSHEDSLKLSLTALDANGETAANEPATVTLGVSEFRSPLKEELIGKKKEDSFTTTLAEGLGEEGIKNLRAKLGVSADDDSADHNRIELKITDISEQQNAAYGEDLYKKAFPDQEINSEEDFRNKIKDTLAKQWEDQATNQLSDQIYHALLDTNLSFPDDFLKKWMLTQGTQGQQQKTPEEVDAEFPQFTNSLKWNLITDKIVQDNNITVEQADLRKATADQLLGYMGGQIDVTQPWINDYIDRMMKDQKYMQDLYQRVMIDKVFNWALTQVNPVETPISDEDFRKMVSEHHH